MQPVKQEHAVKQPLLYIFKQHIVLHIVSRHTDMHTQRCTRFCLVPVSELGCGLITELCCSLYIVRIHSVTVPFSPTSTGQLILFIN